MQNTDKTKLLIAVLGDSEKDSDLRRIIEEGPYDAMTYSSFDALDAGLKDESYLAAILDVDEVPLTSRTIRQLTLKYPEVSFFCTSRSRFHPELKEAICYHLFACLNKPIDPDELHYFLNCIRVEKSGSRGPPP